ncbi:MAG: vitamin B12 transporter [Arenicella sp.]|jgi:vitamin B12 transporter
MFKIKNSAALVAIPALLFFGYGAAIAADPDVPEIVVTAKGNRSLAEILPTVHVITLEDIELAQVRDIPELLDSIAGVSVRDSGGRGSVTSVFVRGTSNSQIIVLIDGVRVGSASLGAAALNSYPIDAIARVEVVKGPLSGIYGADAAGGVIQLFTKKGGQGLGVATATIGSNSLTEYGLSFNGGNQRNSFHVSAQAEETDGIDSTSIVNGGNDDRDGFEETAFSLGAKVTLSDSTVANLSVLYSDSSVEFDNTFGSDTGFITDNKTLSTALNITSRIAETISWSTTLGINEEETDTTSSFPSVFKTDRNSLGTEIQLDLNADAVLTFGADYYEEELTSSTVFPTTERDNTGVFGLFQSTAGKLGFVGSMRYDDNSAYGSDTNGSLALSYDFAGDTRAVLSYGTAFAAPSFNFLYFPFFGNPDILPEESESVELSLVGSNKKFDWRVSLYQNDFDNLFSFDPATFLAANIGEAQIKGVELELNTAVLDWDIALNLDLLSAQDKDSGLELDDRAEKTLALTGARRFGDLDLRFDIKLEDGRFDNRGTELDNYALFDLSARYQFNEKLSLAANVDNIFDKDYTVNLIGANDRYNTEGRQAKLTLRYNF